MTDEKLELAAREYSANEIANRRTCCCDERNIVYESAWEEGFGAGARFERERSKVLIEALRNMPCACVEANPLAGITVDEVCPRCKTLQELAIIDSEDIADE